MNTTFRKEERLCSKKLLEELFHKGSSFLLYPLKFTVLHSSQIQHPFQVVFSVPKRRFKKAVDRNRLKRQMREAFRLKKNTMVQAHPEAVRLMIGITYVGKILHDFQLIDKRMEEGIAKITSDHAGTVV